MSNITATMPFETFVPVQPGFAKSFEDYEEYREISTYTPLPVLFYQFNIPPGNSGLCHVIPSGHIDILFPCAQPPSAPVVYGSVLSRQEISLQPGSLYFGVRLLPIPFVHLTLIPFRMLTNRVIPLEWMLPITHEPICGIQEKGQSFQARITAFNSLFTNQLTTSVLKNEAPADDFYHILNLIYVSRGNLSIADLSSEMGCSTRHFRSLFENYVGIPPKLFCQIIRYQLALSRLLHPSRTAFNDIISDHGYYDQAHFIHEFRKFSRESPTRLMCQLLQKS